MSALFVGALFAAGFWAGVLVLSLAQGALEAYRARRELRARVMMIEADWRAYKVTHPSADPEAITIELPLTWRP